MTNSTIKTTLGTYVHSKMAPEASALLAARKSRKPSGKRSKRIAPGAAVLYMGRPATVVSKHPTNKGWWTVEVEVEGRTVQTSGERRLIKVI